jgi:YD repeat-containing protein
MGHLPSRPKWRTRTEHFTYDEAGRLDTFKNRAGNVQSFAYDALNRFTGFNWDDGLTPSVSFGYDAASRLININNANANITRAYYNDNLLRSETEQILLVGGRSKTTSYTYDADGNRASTTYPDLYAFGYTYTGRNQLQAVNNWATYVYDARGNLLTRTLIGNGKHSDYIYDARDRVTWATHTLNVTRGFNYGYQPNSDNRKYANGHGPVWESVCIRSCRSGHGGAA